MTWEQLTSEYKKLAGMAPDIVLAPSTLPNRYTRMKTNFAVINEEDKARLLLAKKEVEEAFEADKWDEIARTIEENGGDSYEVSNTLVIHHTTLNGQRLSISYSQTCSADVTRRSWSKVVWWELQHRMTQTLQMIEVREAGG